MRLLLALLIACLAVPAMAAPHGNHPPAQSPAMAPAMDHDHGHDRGHEAPAPDRASPRHECIGCIPPTEGLSRFAAASRFAIVLRHVLADMPAPAAFRRAPDTPPPRSLS